MGAAGVWRFILLVAGAHELLEAHILSIAFELEEGAFAARADRADVGVAARLLVGHGGGAAQEGHLLEQRLRRGTALHF